MAGKCRLLAVIALVLTWGMGAPLAIPACVDHVSCSMYGSSVCTDPQYYQWVSVNCPRTCNLCSDGMPAGEGKLMVNTQPTCTDKLTNCADYGTKMCEDPKFYTWTNDNCRKHCNRCSQKCENTIPNCADYGDTLCTDLSYYNWVEMHCRKYCARCTS